MPWLREAFAAYQPLLALLHGQTFFILGLSILLLSRRSARLKFARGLLPLSPFGFCEAIVAWTPVWIVASGVMPYWLGWLRLLLLGVGYAILLAFALQTRVPPERSRWRRWSAAIAILVLWLIGLLVAHLAGVPAERIWLDGEVVARYVLALPGGLIGAWGLRSQSYRTIESERLPLVKPYLRVTEVALGSFALFGGLIGPAASFFPATWFNQELLLQVTGIPSALLRGLSGAGIAYGIVRTLGVIVSEIDLWLESMEQVETLALERERIGRELHDGIIQSIYAAGLMLEGALHSIPDAPNTAREQLTRAIGSLNRTIQDIRRYIFDLRGKMPDDDLETILQKVLRDFRVNTLLETEFTVEGTDTRPLGTERRRHIFQIAREALTNTAKHAQARRVEVCLRYGVNALQLRVSDDGVGLSALPIGKGQGLKNIRERTRLLGGMLDIDTAPDKGMTLILTVPY